MYRNRLFFLNKTCIYYQTPSISKRIILLISTIVQNNAKNVFEILTNNQNGTKQTSLVHSVNCTIELEYETTVVESIFEERALS